MRGGGVNQFSIQQTQDSLHSLRIIPHARTLRKAREQVKMMVVDDVSLPKIRNYLLRWAYWWTRTSGTWNLQELSYAYIQSCWDARAVKIAKNIFQQNYFIELRNCESIALAA